MFTYHHDNPDAIWSIYNAVRIAGLNICRVWVYGGEKIGSIHIKTNDRATLDMLIVCRKGSAPFSTFDSESVLSAVKDEVAKRKISSYGDAWVIACSKMLSHMIMSASQVMEMHEKIMSIDLYKHPQGVLSI
jgi:adenine-specific DNA methylase